MYGECSCERCGADLRISETAVTLVGGRLAYLCIACRNAWREWIKQQPVWGELGAVNARDHFLERSATAGHLVAEADWLMLSERRERVEQRAYDLSGVWLEEHKTKPQEIVQTLLHEDDCVVVKPEERKKP